MNATENFRRFNSCSDSYLLHDFKSFKTKCDSKGDTIMTYKTTQINNRRYLGNKYKLLPFIKKVVNENCNNINSIADIFSGTGAVASAFLDKKVISNDILYSNYICHIAWFSSQSYSKNKIINYITFFNQLDINEDNYMTQYFADTYFSRKDCSKIGFIREYIEKEYSSKKINYREYAILITSLLYAMDKIANTCGHYDAYRKNGVFDKSLELYVPLPSENNNCENQCYNQDANILVKSISADLVYIDPPYNSRQYCDAYHLIENVARWEKPSVFGVARKMDRTTLKSNYCTVNATKSFENLIENINARYILVSYNNIGNKGNNRSNAKISDKDIIGILEKKGRVKVFSKSYKAFTTGKSDIQNNEERLFLCECDTLCIYPELISSPLNYLGGKYKLLPQITPYFPNNIDTFVDLFCGGCNVGININCKKVLFNDINNNLIGLFQTLKKLKKDNTIKLIDTLIKKYGLSCSSQNGYAYYNCNSSKGLASYNKNKYLKLRDDFNSCIHKDSLYYIMLYVLIVYSFNNQIRFNQIGNFNLPVGKRDFNNSMRDKLSKFIDRLKEHNYEFSCKSFLDIDINLLSKDSFIYADPPYLITCATYNEQNSWNESLEFALYEFLDKVHNHGLKFALSNVISSNDKENIILKDWLSRNSDKYKVIHLNHSYSNSNYQRKNKEKFSDEVLIINY